MRSTLVKGWLSLLLLVLLAYGGYTLWRAANLPAASDDLAIEPSRPLEDFEFVDADGKPFPLASLKGRPWVASFFFTSCPGFCLEMNRQVAALAQQVAGQDVTFVSFTVDPGQDTPEALKNYAQRIGATDLDWVFLTGDMAEIESVGRDVLKVPVSKDHSDRLVLVDGSGKVRGWYAARDANKVKLLARKLNELHDAAH